MVPIPSVNGPFARDHGDGDRSHQMTDELRTSRRFPMSHLEAETGFSARTVRYYITQGLLPPAHGRGPSATYDDTHLLRLRAIRRLKDRHLPLLEIKAALGDLRDEEIAAQLRDDAAPPPDRWQRISLHPNLELHVRDLGSQHPDRRFEDAVDMIVKQAQLTLESFKGRQ